ncbi:hypothetical protein DY000_02049453 [Brassica cretica]|uniref:DET1- and DDB1-associated protein 1 n=1 Tax=Brassica cretica TaxID=69181 RepID=A0ABQ7F0W5_BRACR|nr:hypothetical protein DY000_02049453 [Brassica cretica]
MPLTLLPGYDTLVFGPYDRTGAFPRTAVRPDDPIQNRGHDKQDEDEGEAQIKEEQPRNRRCVQVILARPSSSSDEEEDNEVRDSHKHSNKRPSQNGVPEESNDLRNKLR